MKRPCCYYCKWWSSKKYVKYAHCIHSDKIRLDTGEGGCPSLPGDYCTLFEPVGGWSDEWLRIKRRMGNV